MLPDKGKRLSKSVQWQKASDKLVEAGFGRIASVMVSVRGNSAVWGVDTCAATTCISFEAANRWKLPLSESAASLVSSSGSQLPVRDSTSVPVTLFDSTLTKREFTLNATVAKGLPQPGLLGWDWLAGQEASVPNVATVPKKVAALLKPMFVGVINNNEVFKWAVVCCFFHHTQ